MTRISQPSTPEWQATQPFARQLLPIEREALQRAHMAITVDCRKDLERHTNLHLTQAAHLLATSPNFTDTQQLSPRVDATALTEALGTLSTHERYRERYGALFERARAVSARFNPKTTVQQQLVGISAAITAGLIEAPRFVGWPSRIRSAGNNATVNIPASLWERWLHEQGVQSTSTTVDLAKVIGLPHEASATLIVHAASADRYALRYAHPNHGKAAEDIARAQGEAMLQGALFLIGQNDWAIQRFESPQTPAWLGPPQANRFIAKYGRALVHLDVRDVEPLRITWPLNTDVPNTAGEQQEPLRRTVHYVAARNWKPARPLRERDPYFYHAWEPDRTHMLPLTMMQLNMDYPFLSIAAQLAAAHTRSKTTTDIFMRAIPTDAANTRVALLRLGIRGPHYQLTMIDDPQRPHAILQLHHRTDPTTFGTVPRQTFVFGPYGRLAYASSFTTTERDTRWANRTTQWLGSLAIWPEFMRYLPKASQLGPDAPLHIIHRELSAYGSITDRYFSPRWWKDGTQSVQP